MGTAEEEADESAGDEGAAEADPPGLVFLDPQLQEEARDALENALGYPVRVLHPDALDAGFPRPADRAIVVPLALPTQSGLDLVETLRLREHGAEVPIAMVDEAPTRSKVLAALRVGATSFATLPYDADELRARLGNALDAGAAGEANEAVAAGEANEAVAAGEANEAETSSSDVSE